MEVIEEDNKVSVPKQWTNIVAEELEDGIVVKVWGREYTFKNSLFPSSIISAGKEMLYSPIELVLRCGGKEREVYEYQYRVREVRDDIVTLHCAALCHNLVINAAIKIEYDGYIAISLNFVPQGVWSIVPFRKPEDGKFEKVTKALLRVRLKKEASSLFHYWPNGKDSVKSEPYIVPSSEYKEMVLPFKPCIWVGCEDYGLNVCMESDEYIRLCDSSQCIKTTMHEEYHEIEYTLLDTTPREWTNKSGDYVNAYEPMSYDFIFQATPVKEFDRELENEWRVYHTSNLKENFDEIARLGTKWVIFHEAWAMIQNYWLAYDEKVLIDAVNKCHELGMKVMVYFGYEYSTAMLDWNENNKLYCNKNERGTYSGGWTRTRMHQRDFITCYKSDYSDVMLDSVNQVIERYGVDGIYTDQTYVPWGCANEAHGCGYRDLDGNLHVTYPIRALREHVKKLYEAVHHNGGLVDAHQSTCCMMPTLSFCDTYFDGENLQEMMAKKLNDFVSFPAFRCEFLGRNFGIISQFVTVLAPGFNMRNLLSVTLIHNVTARAYGGRDRLDVVSKIWNGYDAIGVTDAKWCPYWENEGSLNTDDENVYISTFEKDDKILAFISYFGKEEKNIKVSLPKKFRKAEELFEAKNFDINNGCLTCDLESKTAYMFLIK